MCAIVFSEHQTAKEGSCQSQGMPLAPLLLVAATPPSRPHALLQTDSTQLPSSNFSVVKAARDSRLFRALELANGIRLVLVSDAKAEMAGASLDVHVGSYSDPDDLPGLAHFCEHMLFLASKK